MLHSQLEKCSNIKQALEALFVGEIGSSGSSALANILFRAPDIAIQMFGVIYSVCLECPHEGKCQAKGQGQEKVAIPKTEVCKRVTFC